MSKIGLVLSGGGTRGVAHLGALKALEEFGAKFDAIAGCSAGAIVGAMYATGKSANEISEFILNKKITDFFNFSISKLGIKNMDKLQKLIKEFTGAENFEDLKIPLFINATNLSTGKEKIFSKGNLFDAIRASISVPGVFSPHKINDNYYIDGGVLDQNPFSILPKNIDKYIIINSSPFKIIKDEKDISVINILRSSLKMMQNEITKIKLESIPENNYILITPDTNDLPILEIKNRFPFIMSKGEIATQKQKQKIINFLKNGR